MAGKVLDAYSILTYLEGGPESLELVRLIKRARDSEQSLLVCAVNWGEAFSLIQQELGSQKASEIERMLETLPIASIPADQAIARQAAIYKATRDLPYTTCFAAALAKVRRAELVTGDKIFSRLAGDIKIRWLPTEHRRTQLIAST